MGYSDIVEFLMTHALDDLDNYHRTNAIQFAEENGYSHIVKLIQDQSMRKTG
jgi:hypothetical protein